MSPKFHDDSLTSCWLNKKLSSVDIADSNESDDHN